MEAGSFGALRSALHRRPSAPLYKKICALVAQDDGSQDDDTQLDYARAIMDRTWPDALRTAYLKPRPDPQERHELLLARAWHVMGTPAIIERLASHDLPPPPTIKLIAPRSYGYSVMALNPTALLAVLPILPDHLDLSDQQIWGGELPGCSTRCATARCAASPSTPATSARPTSTRCSTSRGRATSTSRSAPGTSSSSSQRAPRRGSR
jgi:hypothetical protein